MCRIQELKNTFILFYLFGQTTYIPFKNQNKKFLSIFSFAVKIFPAIVTIMSIIAMFITPNIYPIEKENIHIDIIFQNFEIFMCFSNIFGTYLKIIDSFSSQSLLESFSNSIKYFETQLHITISLSQLERKYRRMILLTPLFHSIYLIFKAVSGFYSNSISYLIFKVAILFKDIAVLHMTLYIELIGVIISSLNEKINKILVDECDDRDTVYLLRQFKWIHLKLLKIVKMFNDKFGWILIFTTLESLLHAIGSLSVLIVKIFMENHAGYGGLLLQLLCNYNFLH